MDVLQFRPAEDILEVGDDDLNHVLRELRGDDHPFLGDGLVP